MTVKVYKGPTDKRKNWRLALPCRLTTHGDDLILMTSFDNITHLESRPDSGLFLYLRDGSKYEVFGTDIVRKLIRLWVGTEELRR